LKNNSIFLFSLSKEKSYICNPKLVTMAVGIFVEPDFYTIGTGNFLFCFFSNIAYHLENGQWGNRFPY